MQDANKEQEAQQRPQESSPDASKPQETQQASTPGAQGTPASTTPTTASTDKGHLLHMTLPHRGVSVALIAGAIAGLLYAIINFIIVLLNTGTFQAASQQIAGDRLTVKTALAIAVIELIIGILGLLTAFITGIVTGKIVVRRHLGFLTGIIAGGVFFLLTFLVSLIPGYAGNLTPPTTLNTAGSFVLPFLQLCLWCIVGGLVSLGGNWVATVRHPYYMSEHTTFRIGRKQQQ